MKRLIMCVLFLASCEGANAPRYIPSENVDETAPGSWEWVYIPTDDTGSEDDNVLDQNTGSIDYDSGSSGSGWDVPTDTDSPSDTISSWSDSESIQEETEETIETEEETVETDSVQESYSETEETVETHQDDTIETEEVVDTGFEDSLEPDTGSESAYVDTVSETEFIDTEGETDIDTWVDTGTGINTNPDTDWVTDPDTGEIPCPLNDAMFGGSSDTCWYLGGVDESCSDVCSKYGGEYSFRTSTYLGARGANQRIEAFYACRDVVSWFGVYQKHPGAVDTNNSQLGCHYDISHEVIGLDVPYTSPDAHDIESRRLCACIIY